MPVLRHRAVEVDLCDEDREQHGAHDHAKPEAQAGPGPGRGCSFRLVRRHARSLRAGRRWPGAARVGHHGAGWRAVRARRGGRHAGGHRRRRGARGASSGEPGRRCCSCTGSAARRRTSTTRPMRWPSATTSSTFDHRGHGESDAPADAAVVHARPAGARHARRRGRRRRGSVPAPRPLDGRDGRPPRRARAPDRVDALVLMDTSPGPVPGLDGELMEMGAVDRAARGDGRAQAGHGCVRAARHSGVRAAAGRAAGATGSSTTASGRRSRR